jgi:RNA polymerase sigma-70 factor (ECF subfamily)
MVQLEDPDLVCKSLQGDMKAFEVLIDRYKQMVFTLACRIIRNKEDAEEIAQDTFLKAHNALETFKGESKFSTWLYKIAYYRSLDQLKKKKRHISSVSLDQYRPTDIKEMSGVLDELERQDRVRIVKAAINRLNEEDAAIVTLFYFEELSIREIAEIVSLSPEVLKVRLFRSRKQLAILLSSTLLKEKVTNYEH